MFKEKFINFTIIAHIVAGIILIFGKKSWFPDFYWPVFMGVFALIWAFLIISPSLIIKSNNESKLKAVKNLQLFLAAAFSLNGLGSLGLFQLYKYGFQYDKLAHFITPMMATLTLVNLIGAWRKIEFKKMILIAIIAITLFGFAWELLELLSDIIFKSKTFGFYGEKLTKDTIMDIVFNSLGIISGAIILIRRNRKQISNLNSH